MSVATHSESLPVGTGAALGSVAYVEHKDRAR